MRSRRRLPRLWLVPVARKTRTMWQFVDQLDIRPHSVLDQSSPKPRTLSLTRTLLSAELLKVREAKARDRSRRGSLKARRVLRDLLFQDRLSPRLLEVTELSRSPRSCVADGFLFAMMSTKSKPTWRHATWNSADYMVCNRVEPQRSSLFQACQIVDCSSVMMPRA